MTRLSNRAAIGLVIASLGIYDVTRRLLIPESLHFLTNTAMIGVTAGIAIGAGLSRDEAGLTREALPTGLRVGGLAVLGVGAAVAVASLVMGVDSDFVQERIDLSAAEMLFQVLVEIPIATVLFEELAFRGVLGPLFHLVLSPWRAVLATSALFGLWHVPGAWTTSLGGVLVLLGTFAATTAAGVVLQVMKDRTHSLAAPALTHWATNGLALLVVWLVGRWG